ncbi:MAG: DUF4340 domain-containing protein [Polyangiaceae bacterium]|nr:DUF4340 domain-containing protein [Polyangiaceae bacterium]
MALTNQHKIYAAGAVLALLAGGVYLKQRDAKLDDDKHTKRAGAAALPEVKISAEDVDKITKIELKNADKGSVVLEKADGKWRVKKPVDYPANEQNVKTLLDNMKELKAKELIDPSPSAYAEYQVDDVKGVHATAYKGADKALDMVFGKSGGRGQMARKLGADGVFAISGYSSYLYTREAKGWRDNAILKFDDAKVTKVEIENEHGALTFTKDGEAWSAKQKKDKLERFDDAKLKDMLRAYKALTAEDYGDGKADADTGLDKPATLTFSLSEGDPVKVRLGKTATGESRYLVKEGSPQVFVVSSWAAGWGVAKADKFQKPEEKKDDKDKKKDEKKDEKKK